MGRAWTNEVATDRSGNKLPGITKRTATDGSISYQVRLRMRGHPTQTASFKRLTDARRWQESTRSAIRESRYFGHQEQNRTVGEAIDRYIQTVMPQKRESTRTTQIAQLGWWKREIGEQTLTEVTPALLVHAREKLQALPGRAGKHLSNATVVRYLAFFSHVLTTAHKEWGWLESNPALLVSKPAEPQGRVRFLQPEERQRLLEACTESRNPYLYAIVLLALTTGARKGEIMRLTWPSVDLERRLLVLHVTKNKERRGIPIIGGAYDSLCKLHQQHNLQTELLFPPKIDSSKPMDIRTPWETALKRAQISDFHFHDLRHTTASYLAMSGASMVEIADVLGHKTLQMVKRYAHLSDGHKATVLERMNVKFLS